MDVTIHERTPVDLDLEVRATKEELEPRVKEALKARQKQTNLKGFRPGKVPLNHIRKMAGPAIAAQLAEAVVGEAYREHVASDEGREVIGQPQLRELDYDLGEDLRAVITFGVRPEFDLADTAGQEVRRLVRPVAEEDVEEEIGRRRHRAAVLTKTVDAVDADSVAIVDMQVLDRETDTPVIGERHADQELDLADERLRAELRDALVGKAAGDQFRVSLPHEHDEGHDHGPAPAEAGDHVDRFLVTVKTVKARDLPELDEAFVKGQTADNVETVEAYREMVRSEMEDASRRLGEDVLRGEIVEKLIAAHEFDVPEALIEAVLDEMEGELARRANIGSVEELPTVLRQQFRAEQRGQAEQQARWNLIRARALDDLDLQLSEEDFEAEFERMAASGPGTAEMVKQFVQPQPQLLQGIQQRLVNDRLFDALAERFTVVDRTPEELEAEREAEAQAETEAAEPEAEEA